MSTKPYSKDLRIRVLESIKSGKTQVYTSIKYGVSTSAVNRWWKRYQESKEVMPKPRLGSKGKIDLKKLTRYVEGNSDRSLEEIARVFKVSASAIYRRLKQLGYSYKKKPSPMWKRAQLNEKDTKRK